jgi:PAP2 superfamily
MHRAGSRARRALRIVPLGLYVVTASWSWRRHGIPVLPDRLLPWLLGLLLALSVTDLRRFARGLIVDWLPFILALTSYDLLRGIADGRLFPAHARPQMWVDTYLFGFGTVPTVFLQRHLWDPAHLHWYDYASWAVYMTHFVATPLLAAALWLWAPSRFRRFAVLVVAISFAAMATYVVYPAMPPWLASDTHVLPPLGRIIGVVSAHVPIVDGRGLYEQGTAWSNEIAAMPSLHEGLALLFSITLWPLAGRAGRVVLVLYPLAMAFALVYSAEHYVIEVVLGCVYTVAVYAFVQSERGHRAFRRLRDAARVLSTPQAPLRDRSRVAGTLASPAGKRSSS